MCRGLTIYNMGCQTSNPLNLIMHRNNLLLLLLLHPSPCLLASFLHTPSLRDLDVSSYLCSQQTTPTSLPSFMLTCVTAPARREEKYVDVSEHAGLCVFTSEPQLYDQVYTTNTDRA